MVSSDIGRRRARALREGGADYVAKRRRMLQEAAVLFREKGYDATTLADVAAAVGVERASLYYYVSSKEELLRETVTQVSAANLDLTVAIKDSDLSPTERIRAFVTSTVVAYDAHHHEVSVFLRDGMPKIWSQDDAWSELMRRQIRDFESALDELLRSGVRDGAFRADLDLRLVARALWGMVNWVHRWHRPGGTSPERIADTFVEVLVSGMLVGPAPESRPAST